MLVFRLEAVVRRHPAQQILDSAGAGVGDSGTVGSADDDLLVFGADPPIRPRLAAFLEVANQVLFLFQQLTHRISHRAAPLSSPLQQRLSLPASLPPLQKGEGPGGKVGSGKRAYNGLTQHTRQAELSARFICNPNYTPPPFSNPPLIRNH